jgi:hypothetical protein
MMADNTRERLISTGNETPIPRYDKCINCDEDYVEE